MKNLIKKYYEMDNEVRDDLELLYIYQTVKINTIGDLEKLMHIIQKCMIITDFSADCIVTNMLEVLEAQDITIKDLYDLEIDDLLEVLFTDVEDDNDEDCQNENLQNNEDNKQEILSEFSYGNYYCIFCQNRDKYLLIINKGENSDVIVINSINEIFDGTFQRKLAELKLDE